MAKFDEVNIAEVFSQIEIELLQNLTASLASGNWRSQRAKAIKAFKRRNQEILSGYNIDAAVKRQLEAEYQQAGQRVAAEMQGHEVSRKSNHNFKVDNRRMKSLIGEMQGTMHKVSFAARRQVEDMYRKGMAKTQTMLASNLFTLDECVDMATRDFLVAGVNCIKYKDGRTINITSYAEMALRTNSRRVTLQAEGAMRADFGVFTVLISQYGACSNTCLPHQGKVHFDDYFAGGNPKDNTAGYPLLSTAIASGLFHPNCRHKSSTYYPEESTTPPPMNEPQVKENAALEEKQRYNERQIKKWKRMRDCSQSPVNQAKYDRKVRDWQAKQRDLINKYPDVLSRDYHREKAGRQYTPTQKSSIIKEGQPKILDYGTTDTRERDLVTPDSLGKHVDAKGNLTPEREQLHREIIDKAFEDVTPADGKPIFTVMGGGPAAGKSSMLNGGGVQLPPNSAMIDSDSIKGQLPEYTDMVKAGNKDAARYVHEESSALAKRMLNVANDNGYNVVLDGTGDGSVASLSKKIQDAKAAGMRVEGVYATVPTQVAIDRSTARALKTGREVPLFSITSIHKKVSQILPECTHMFDAVSLYDTTGNAILIATGGNGKGLTPVPGMEKLFEEFLKKAREEML